MLVGAKSRLATTLDCIRKQSAQNNAHEGKTIIRFFYAHGQQHHCGSCVSQPVASAGHCPVSMICCWGVQPSTFS
jgi:hypothetical protein